MENNIIEFEPAPDIVCRGKILTDIAKIPLSEYDLFDCGGENNQNNPDELLTFAK